MNKYSLSALSVCGGVLSGLAWTEWCPGLILLFSFVPFFIIENHLYENRRRYSPNACFLYLLPGFVIFAILTLGWIRAISMTAAICVILITALLMAFTMWLAYRIRLREGDVQGYMSLIAFWLTLEFLCLRIPVLSPGLTLVTDYRKTYCSFNGMKSPVLPGELYGYFFQICSCSGFWSVYLQKTEKDFCTCQYG